MIALYACVNLPSWMILEVGAREKGVRATAVCPSFVRTEMSSYTQKVTPDEMIQPETLAHLIRTTVELPNTAAIAELLVNCRLEDTL